VAALEDTEENREDQRWLGDLNVALLLGIAQDIDVDHVRPLDIDHIYASARAGRMHATDNSRMHHTERWRVNTVGNMWWLDAGANRALHDQSPPMKFRKLEDWLGATPMSHRVWPKRQWSITESEIGRFILVDTEIDDDIDGAMKKFADLVQTRADRLLESPFEVLPDAKLFARDTELKPSNDGHPTDGVPPMELAERLGPTEVLKRFEKSSPRRDDVENPPVPGARRPISKMPLRWGVAERCHVPGCIPGRRGGLRREGGRDLRVEQS
jgi:hypothetical protein